MERLVRLEDWSLGSLEAPAGVRVQGSRKHLPTRRLLSPPHPAPEPLTEQTRKGAALGLQGGAEERPGPFCAPLISLGASFS